LPGLVAAASLAAGGCGERGPAAPPEGGLAVTPLAPAGPRPDASGPRFRLLDAAATGVDFENRFAWDHDRKHLYSHGYAGGGVCVGDVDDDGRPDLYLVSQTGTDRLYRQAGDLVFEDVTVAAGVDHAPTWGTGAAFADVDGDGALDLYVCNYDAPNRLYLNRGDGTFREAAAEMGLDFHGASVMAAFADYDADGDLDVYLLTNRLYPGPAHDQPRTRQVDGQVAVEEGLEEAFAIQERIIGGRRQKFVVKAGQPDRLYRNDGDAFTDVTAAAGIAGNHPGLSATWWDADGDGRPDLYVGNDFWDPDRLYRNNGDGTFTDVLEETMPHTPWFSMGADFGDLDNDGLLDFVAADMSATSHEMSKIMMGDMDESRWFLQSAIPRQYMRNAVYLNTGTSRFMEVAHLAGLASTDWTWSVKIGDLDNDGRLDAFFTNGTANHSFDPDLTRALRALESEQDRRGLRDPVTRWEEQWSLTRTRPPRAERNLAFRNGGDLDFVDATDAWGLGHLGVSFGAVLADLDRDGDLDVVVSHVDDPVSIYRNDSAEAGRLLVRLRGTGSNRFGLGAEVTVETEAGRQVRLLAPTRGYMSANEPVLHFGLGSATRVTRLTVRWPSGHVQRFDDVAADRLCTITEPDGPPPPPRPHAEPAPLFREVAEASGLALPPRIEHPYDDYEREPLLPARLSRPGPGLAWGDADGDGDDDLFVGAGRDHAGVLLVNDGDGTFSRGRAGPWVAHRSSEDTAVVWLDADVDGDLDLYVASGSVECDAGAPVLRDRLYLNDGRGRFVAAVADALPDAAESTGAVVAGDWDADGDLDLFVGARSIPGRYPLVPRSRLLRNDRGRFVDVTSSLAPGLERVGLVTGALLSDADGDGRLDLLVALEWGPVALWRNTEAGFVDATAEAGLAETLGWWNGLAAGDLDDDGDLDYLAMNAGLNTKYRASPEKPALLYYGDLAGDGGFALVEAKRDDERLLPVRGLSCSAHAMPIVGERMPTYRAFAGASLGEIYTAERLEAADVLRATELASVVLVNEGGGPGDGAAPVRFTVRPLPRRAQASPGFGVVASDLDGDGRVDVPIVQNFFWREPETGRWDGGIGMLLRGTGGGVLEPVAPAKSGLVVPGDATALTLCDLEGDGQPDLVVARNDDRLLAFRNGAEPGRFRAVRLAGPPGNPTGVGARVTVRRTSGRDTTAEIHAGSGYLAQSSPTLFFGDASTAVEARVSWPDGAVSIHPLGGADGARTMTLAHPALAEDARARESGASGAPGRP
jgi:hypothetical protein